MAWIPISSRFLWLRSMRNKATGFTIWVVATIKGLTSWLNAARQVHSNELLYNASTNRQMWDDPLYNNCGAS